MKYFGSSVGWPTLLLIYDWNSSWNLRFIFNYRRARLPLEIFPRETLETPTKYVSVFRK